jgi:primosomal protein N' (replication factor Y)
MSNIANLPDFADKFVDCLHVLIHRLYFFSINGEKPTLPEARVEKRYAVVNLMLPLLAESGTGYAPIAATPKLPHAYLEVLVDCPGAQGLFTYRLSSTFAVQPGDILSVPFGAQQVGAIALRSVAEPPPELDPTQIREIEAIVTTGFFPPTYWQLLHRVAEYYCTPLMTVVRAALPPGLLARSQRRVRLLQAAIPDTITVSPVAQALLQVLQSSKTGDYSWQHLQRQVKDAGRGLKELLQAGWVENYLEPPQTARPKLRQAVTLVPCGASPDLTVRQQEVLQVLKRQGGEVWLTDLLQLCQVTSSVVKALAQKGFVVLQPREVLRSEAMGAIVPDQAKSLTPAQTNALAEIQALSGFTQVLLHGVTGSGKTEVYLQAIAPVLQRGQSALVLVPEIGLTPQLTDRFRARFGDQVCVYHSALGDGERYDTWRQLLLGEPQVLIGTRSAVFAPIANLGLVVLDEEHDSSFKQDQPAPCYHARTVAQWRAQLENCPLILGSATPALETWVAAQSSDSARYLSLPTRVYDRPMPQIEIVDMRQELFHGNSSIFSQSLQQALRSLKASNQQGILFIHRRGHSTFVSCRSCGYVVTCPNCDVSLSFHHVHADATPLLRCHYCNHVQSVPKTCPSCDSTYFKHFGSGTQRVAQEFAAQFPDLRILRFDSDTTRAKGAHRSLLTQFAAGEADVLVGTQMLTKGIDLPQVTLVGIIAADGLLHFADYRASERTFQTLTQVAGRCGRGDDRGRVILQTYSPEHPVIQAVQQQNYAAFVEQELQYRAGLNYPPSGRLMLLRFSSVNPVAVQTAAERVAAALLAMQLEGVECLGPAPATILRIDRRFRWQLLLKIGKSAPAPILNLADLRALCASSVSLTIDVDPLHLL